MKLKCKKLNKTRKICLMQKKLRMKPKYKKLNKNKRMI